MRIEEDVKLGFKDVLIWPKRSTLKSRSDVELERQFTFLHTGGNWSGVPMISRFRHAGRCAVFLL
ncbi:hypothetical protein OI69_06755 [Pectobacterium fontis]|uniref:GMP reductase n=1 Tax=Pectobacterium fontis TaxID=2558042 RepID=A0A7V8IK56_9GAMM|nr:hypothetical protein OI69_06755 [Pectobacterium fontis]